ncbi:MAG: hypothetical protein JHC87_07235, partial [Thermoleophilaceae bacterium]|nr:hypothetical protein [Thermoleophilaceae bacterium]
LAQLIAAQATVTNAELVGLAPSDAFNDWPDDLPISNFDPKTSLIENVLAVSRPDGV